MIDDLPEPMRLIEETDWNALEVMFGPETDCPPVPTILNDLLNGSPDSQAAALRDLDEAVHHQNTLVTATAPAALFVAAILHDPRTKGRRIPDRTDGSSRLLHEVLLKWLTSVFKDASDETMRRSHEFGFPLDERPAVQRIRAIRPTVHRAVAPLENDPEPLIRDAAIAATAPLLSRPTDHHKP